MHVNPIVDKRRGVMLVLIAVCLPLCIIMAAFAIDVAWMQLVRTELRSATDSAARAAAKGLSLYQDENVARQMAKQAAGRNQVGGAPMTLADEDIIIGESTRAGDASRFTFTPGGDYLNSVRVNGRRTEGSAAGPVNLLFSGVLGVTQFEPTATATSTQLDRDICLVLDRSGSMMQEAEKKKVKKKSASCDPPDAESRWTALRIAVNAFIEELEKTRQDEWLAMVSYSSNTVDCKLKFNTSDINSDLVGDYSPIRSELDRISSNPVKGRTNIGAGLDDGIDVLTGSRARRYAVKTIILLTDGLQNEGVPAVQVARTAAAKDIVIHTITFSDEADQAGMKQVAAATKGRHFHAPNSAELVRIFKEIANTLPVLTTE